MYSGLHVAGTHCHSAAVLSLASWTQAPPVPSGMMLWHEQRCSCWWGSFWLCQTQLCFNVFMCLPYLSVWLLCVKSHEQSPGCCLIWLMAISHINTIRWGLMASSPHVINSGQMPSGHCCVFVAHTLYICSHLCPNVWCFAGQCWAPPKGLRQQAQGTIHRGTKHTGTL